MVVLQRLLDLTSVTLRLRRTLLDLQQYDLSGKITQTENYSRYHGGFSDVYFGQSLVHNKDVAIKRVRYRLHDDLTFLKVIHYFNVESLMLILVDI